MQYLLVTVAIDVVEFYRTALYERYLGWLIAIINNRLIGSVRPLGRIRKVMDDSLWCEDVHIRIVSQITSFE